MTHFSSQTSRTNWNKNSDFHTRCLNSDSIQAPLLPPSPLTPHLANLSATFGTRGKFGPRQPTSTLLHTPTHYIQAKPVSPTCFLKPLWTCLGAESFIMWVLNPFISGCAPSFEPHTSLESIPLLLSDHRYLEINIKTTSWYDKLRSMNVIYEQPHKTMCFCEMTLHI